MNKAEQEAARAGREQHNASSPLLRLPPELRNRIYDYVASGVKLVNVPYHNRKLDTMQDIHANDNRLITAATKICRAIRNEITTLLWSQVECLSLNFDSKWMSEAAHDWLASTAFERRSRNESIGIFVWESGRLVDISFVQSVKREHTIEIGTLCFKGYNYDAERWRYFPKTKHYLDDMNKRHGDHKITSTDVRAVIWFLTKEAKAAGRKGILGAAWKKPPLHSL
jgi:hypothetical protein